jgi:hypothetical protein
MKKIIPITLLVMLSAVSFGQKIHFTDTSNKWHGFTYAPELVLPNAFPYSYYYSDTITYSGVVYLQLFSPGFSVSAYVREDTSAGKVYAVEIGPLSDSTEHVLYDYNLHVNDTFKYPHMTAYYVTATDSVLINSIWHKTWHLAPVNDTTVSHMIPVEYDVIQGIGSVQMPLFPANPTVFEFYPYLTCFDNHSFTPRLSHKVGTYFDNDTSCSLSFGLGVGNIVGTNRTTTVIPNPINETSKIAFSSTISSGNLIIINSIGQKIISLPFQNKDEVLIGDKIKVPGIYFYHITDNQGGQMFSGKFVNP